MVTLRALAPDDAPDLARIYSGASIRHTTGKPLTLDQAHEMIRAALARAAESPRAQWSWGILAAEDGLHNGRTFKVRHQAKSDGSALPAGNHDLLPTPHWYSRGSALRVPGPTRTPVRCRSSEPSDIAPQCV
ncbi:GNAT family N-acetyltransferase [Streptomyces sp. LaBMicrA B280]|uniref:GNAT family N-acetyltransferase n=1 Tax=Streptomyces sp. LaBMicrA B280 TaxID=3391001 RepID=UPI003BA5D5AB